VDVLRKRDTHIPPCAGKHFPQDWQTKAKKRFATAGDTHTFPRNTFTDARYQVFP
jgi:hypothetical protein